MNNTYDILVNFNKKLFEIYEWNNNDNIIHIRKIPLFKVSSVVMHDFLYNKIVLSNEFLKLIYCKTDYYLNKGIRKIDYAFLVTDGSILMAIESDGKYITKYSKLLYEDENDILEYAKHMKCINIEYINEKTLNISYFKTRNEENMKKYIFREINNIIKNKEYDKLKYIYLECFNQKDTSNVTEHIFNDLELYWNEVYIKVYNLLKNYL